MRYRLYFLDNANRIVRRRDLVLADDAAATDEATRLSKTHAIEIWKGSLLLSRVEKHSDVDYAPWSRLRG